MIPLARKSVRDFSDDTMVSKMQIAQASLSVDAYRGVSFSHACIQPELSILANDAVFDLERTAFYCVPSEDDTSISFSLMLNSGKWYCIDSEGFSGFVDTPDTEKGSCIS